MTKKKKKKKHPITSSPFVVEEVQEEAEPEPQPQPEVQQPAFEPQPVNQTQTDMNTQDFAATPAPQPQPQFPSNAQKPQSFNSPSQHDFSFNRGRSPKKPWGILVAIAAGLILIFGLYKLIFAKPKQQDQPSVTDILVETSADTSQPESSPQPEAKELDRADFKLQVLNGSGIVGRAGKMATVLEDAGFKNVATANAKNYDYKGVTIQVKAGQDDLGDLIESDLADDYDDITIKDNLDEASDYDAVITVGLADGEELEEDILGATDKESTSSGQ